MTRKIKVTLENRGTSSFNPQTAIVDAVDFAIILSDVDGNKKWEARISVDENNAPIFIFAETQVCSSWGMPALKIKTAKS